MSFGVCSLFRLSTALSLFIITMLLHIRSRALLALATLPCIVYALRIQHQHNNRQPLSTRVLVTLDGCPEDKAFATPYQDNANAHLLSGM